MGSEAEGTPPLSIQPAADLEPPPERVDRARRYPLELTVELGPLRGTTRDISVSGIRFQTDEPGAASLRIGEEVRVVLRFPSTVHGNDYGLHIVGKVVRVEPTRDGRSVALATEEFRFADPLGALESGPPRPTPG